MMAMARARARARAMVWMESDFVAKGWERKLEIQCR